MTIIQKGEPMVDKELIEIWRYKVKLPISSFLFKTNCEGMGEQDKEEFERDFDDILDLALIGLKHKAQLSREGATKDTTSDTISRQAAIEALYDWSEHSMTDAEAWHIKQVIGDIKSLPSAQPTAEPVRHGKWIKADSQQYFRKHYPCFTCSECGYRKDSQKKWNYCPNCGAQMDERKTNEYSGE